MFRHLAFACLVVGFSAFAYAGWAGWARTRDVGPRDEAPLQLGYFPGASAVHRAVMMGNPWQAQGEDVTRLKRDLPPDPWGADAADEIEKANRRLVHDLKVTMPAGPMRWPEILAKLKENFEPAAMPVITGKPEVPSTFVVNIPSDSKWTGFKILSQLTNLSQRLIMYDVTSEGVVVGTDDACKALRLRATLTEARRRVAAVNADPILDVPFRPDLVDATIVSFARAVTAQTGVEVVVDARIWEAVQAIKWRGEPRRLRDALDEICAKLQAYWRYHQGRIWLLRP